MHRIPLILFILLLSIASEAIADPRQTTSSAEYTEQLGVVRSALGRTKDGDSIQARLEVRLAVEHRCTFSDFDAIAFDAMYMPGQQRGTRMMPNPKILVSLEPIIPGDSSFTPRTYPFEKPMLFREKGLNAEFSFPFVEKPQLLGLFICGDTQNEGRCNTRTKEIADFGALFNKYRNVPPKGYRPPDRIYFFRPLVVSSKDVVFITRQMNDTRLQLQNEFFSQELQLFLPPTIRDRIRQLSKKLTSLPLRNVASRPTIILPAYNANRCVWEDGGEQ